MDYVVLMRGRRLTDDRVAELEAGFDPETASLETHLLLLGYYSQARTPSSDRRFLDEALWLIAHRPTSDALGLAHIIQGTNPEGYEEARALWLRVLEHRGQDPAVRASAADFFSFSEPTVALELLEGASAGDPANLELARRLGDMYLRLSQKTSDPMEREHHLDKGLRTLEQGRPPQDDALGQALWLAALAHARFDAGHLEVAAERARELLAVAEQIASTWNYGNAMHEAHTILGRIALAQGDVPTAKAELLESARVRGSPQLGSFGPSLDLAGELLEAGEREAVLEFLELCKGFWRRGETIDLWRSQVISGQIPSFASRWASVPPTRGGVPY